jgi:formyl-CoA transferase
MVEDVETPDARGALHLVGQPVTLTRTPSRIVAAPPERSEHNDEVLAEFGFSAAEIASLRTAKVI